MKYWILIFAAATFLVPSALFGADDTFSCFNQFNGPIIKKFSGDQGYINYAATSNNYTGNWANESRIDARGAIFRQEHFVGDGTKPSNPWLMDIGGNWKHPPKNPLCWVGGRFIGSTPMDFGYNGPRGVKSDAGEAISFNSDGGIIDGVRIHNIGEDGIGVTGDTTSRKPHAPTTIKDTWISHNHANAIESDRIKNLILEDVLIDGSFHPISVDPGSTYNGNYEEKNNMVVISNTLIRNKFTKNSESRLVYQNFIKARSPDPVPHFKVYNTIFAAEGWPDTYSIRGGPPKREKLFHDHIIDCKNNIIAWLPDSPVPPPDVLPRGPSHCFKLVKGKEARNLWAAAKQNWINCHPKVEHVPGDPAANPSQCDPNAYGGGGSGTPSGGGTTSGGTVGGTPVTGRCDQYGVGSTPPSGYGASWNTLNGTQALLSGSCQADGSVDLHVGAGESNTSHYVYKMGYVYRGSAWQPFTLTGPFVQGSTDWITGHGKYVSTAPTSGNYFWVGYICQWTGTVWKCGCRDSACTTNYWQLQGIQR